MRNDEREFKNYMKGLSSELAQSIYPGYMSGIAKEISTYGTQKSIFRDRATGQRFEVDATNPLHMQTALAGNNEMMYSFPREIRRLDDALSVEVPAPRPVRSFNAPQALERTQAPVKPEKSVNRNTSTVDELLEDAHKNGVLFSNDPVYKLPKSRRF